MTIKLFRRKFLRITAYIFGSIIVLLIGFHFWFINHAEQILEDLVKSRSNGKLKLEVKKFKFNWFSSNMQLRHAVFYSTDTTAATTYRFAAEKINIRVKEIWPLIFEKRILIDSLGLVNPDIQVTRLRSNKDSDTSNDKGPSLPGEMGRVYNSIQDALQVLQVDRFQIDNGTFTLINKIRPDELPVTISHIYFHLDNLQVDTGNKTGKQKILFSDNVSLSTHNQDISFPDGRHHLSFRNFHINIPKKFVEFDSCTIGATKGDSTKTSFSVFFDKLQLTNIDFDTLYQKEVIKADSVYCINPQFKLDAELSKSTGKRKPPPKLDELIQLLTGDMELAFVIVNNASFDINTVREGQPSSFTSDHNNFEMQGFRIEKGSPKPLTVESFAMAIRNSENFLRDSSYAMLFDSILFINNSVYLSNFSFNQKRKNKGVNSFTMPQFELKGLSWDDLVFERKLTAHKATLYRPVINYSLADNKKQNIFQTLAAIGKIIQLNNLDIQDGKVNVYFKGGELHLENTSMSLLPSNLVQSKGIANVKQSVNELRFKKGSLKANQVIAEMENATFAGKKGQFTAGAVYITDKEKKFSLRAGEVSVNEIIIDNKSLKEINGIYWQEADIVVSGSPFKNATASAGFVINDIHAGNTKLLISSGDQKITGFLQSALADEFLSKPGTKPRVVNLKTNGNNFSFSNNTLQLAIAKFLFADHHNSVVENVSFKNNTGPDSAIVIIPAANFTPDLNSIINGSIVADNVTLAQPVITIKRFHQIDMEGRKETKLPETTIGKLTVRQPEFSLVQTGDVTMKIEWLGKKEANSFFELSNFKIRNSPSPVITADQFELALNNFSVTSRNKTFTTGKGSINARITGIRFDSTQTDQLNWKAVVADLNVRDIMINDVGKHAGQLEIKSAVLNDLAVRSVSIANFRQLLRENEAFRLKEVTGQFDNTINHFGWHNLGYDKTSKKLSVDSFSFHPTAEKDKFIAEHKYQTDHIMLSTGAINAGPLDIDKYLTDTIIDAGSVNINNIMMKSFRDKRKPARQDVIKPLPVNLVKKIPVRMSLDTVNLNNATIEYAELNEKTNQTGTILINRMKAKIFPVNNYNLQQDDSLHFEARARLMDSLQITLQLKESYTDPLAGFLLTASARPADARILNPVLIPLVSAKLESGFLDTLSMNVVGKEYVSTGEMRMYYHDLKVKILDKGSEKKRSFFKGLANMLANTFVINKNNRSRTGVIFFKRIRNKSSLNYLVKITLNGISSSAGIKKSKRLLRRYKKEQR